MSDSVTHVVRRRQEERKVRRELLNDHLYDPVYSVSSEDHSRTKVWASSKQQFNLLTDFDSMFSAHLRFTVKEDPPYLPPAFSKVYLLGQAEQSSKVQQELAGVAPNAQTTMVQLVTGDDYWKYLKCLLIPVAQQFTTDGNFSLSSDFVTADGDDEPTQHIVGVQTDYRESETQTDPYSPDHLHQPGSTPSEELLQLATLSWGHSLPAGLAEVEMIKRMRAKRAWEASLPPISDSTQLDKRRRMIKEMEAEEWAFREQEIQKLQEARNSLLKDMRRIRDEAQKDAMSQRVNHLHAQLQKESQVKHQKIQNDYLRSLRKLEAKRENVEGKLKRRDIVMDVLTGKNRFPGRLKSCYLDTYEGLEEKEAPLESLMKNLKPEDVIKPSVNTALELLNKYKALREKEKKVLKERFQRLPVEKEKRHTPRVEGPSEEEEQMELAVICLQKLLRGRSVQYQMFQDKENQMANIKELRITHAFQREEQNLLEADKAYVMALKEQREQERERISREEAAHARVVGAELGELFDTLSKELIRLQEERQIHAFTLVAERERRRREAEEHGRRQLDELRCREEDEMFRQVVTVHQNTVDMYLEDIILTNLELVADEQAREEIHRKAKELNEVVMAMEERDSLQSEEIVSELMYNYLVPESEKISIQQKVHLKQQKHLEAALSIILEAAASPGIRPQEPRDPASDENSADQNQEEAERK